METEGSSFAGASVSLVPLADSKLASPSEETFSHESTRESEVSYVLIVHFRLIDHPGLHASISFMASS